MAILKKGTPVQQIVQPISGVVVDSKIIDEEVQYLVAYVVDGVEHSRFFKEGELSPN